MRGKRRVWQSQESSSIWHSNTLAKETCGCLTCGCLSCVSQVTHMMSTKNVLTPHSHLHIRVSNCRIHLFCKCGVTSVASLRHTCKRDVYDSLTLVCASVTVVRPHSLRRCTTLVRHTTLVTPLVRHTTLVTPNSPYTARAVSFFLYFGRKL